MFGNDEIDEEIKSIEYIRSITNTDFVQYLSSVLHVLVQQNIIGNYLYKN